MSRKHLKTAHYGKPPSKAQELPLPGVAGAEILTKMVQGNYNEALDQFYETYIGPIGEIPEVNIVEDDGEHILFVSRRGPFRLNGLGRKLLLDTLSAFKAQFEDQLQRKQAQPSDPENGPET